MHRSVQACVGALLVTGMIGGVRGAAGTRPKRQSTAKYAKTVCQTYSRLESDVRRYADAVVGLDPSILAVSPTEAVNRTDALLTSVRADEQVLRGAYPDVSRGKAIARLLASNAAEIDAAVTAATQQLQAMGPAAAVQFQIAVQTLGSKLTDPFSKVTNQDLLRAFQKEKSCRSVVNVTG